MSKKSLVSSKSQSSIIIVIVLILLSLWNYYSKNRQVKDFELDRNARITYSKHATCRMDCRHIDKSEVKEVLEKGQINTRKSRPRKGTLALETRTHDNQDVRVIFAKKNANLLHVVTVIDLDNEWDCDCN